jgi:hypothetical protein
VSLEDQVLPAGGRRVGAGALADDADDAARSRRVGAHVDARNRGGALVGGRQGGENLDGGGLAGAVRTDEGVDRAGLDGEVETVQGPDAGVLPWRGIRLDEAVGLDGVHGDDSSLLRLIVHGQSREKAPGIQS